MITLQQVITSPIVKSVTDLHDFELVDAIWSLAGLALDFVFELQERFSLNTHSVDDQIGTFKSLSFNNKIFVVIIRIANEDRYFIVDEKTCKDAMCYLINLSDFEGVDTETCVDSLIASVGVSHPPKKRDCVNKYTIKIKFLDKDGRRHGYVSLDKDVLILVANQRDAIKFDSQHQAEAWLNANHHKIDFAAIDAEIEEFSVSHVPTWPDNCKLTAIYVFPRENISKFRDVSVLNNLQ